MLETHARAHLHAPAPLPLRFGHPPETSVSIVQHFQMDIPLGQGPVQSLSGKNACDEYALQLNSLLAAFNCQYAFGEVRVTSFTLPRVSGTHTLQRVPFSGQSADQVMEGLKKTAEAFKNVLTQQGWKFRSSHLAPHMPSA